MNGLRGRLRTRSVELFLVAVVLILIGALLRNYFFAAGEVSYYVSPTGNDASPGTFEAPFRTITKAQTVLRGVAPSGGANVYLRGGDYDVAQTINFIESDSGASGHPITYLAYQNENPVIDGTVDLPAPVASGNNVYTVDMAQVPGVDFRTSGITNLTWNGKAQNLARYPNYKVPNFSNIDPWAGQFLFAASDTPRVKNQIKYVASGSDPSTWSGVGSGVRAVVFSGPNYWDSTVNISSVSSAGRLLNFSDNTTYDMVPNNRFYVENSKTFIDQNGEWFYDKAANKLFIYLTTPPTTTDLFSVVRTGDIFTVSNVSNIGFKNLIVRGSTGAAFNIKAFTAESKNIAIVGNEISLTAREGIRAGGRISGLVVDGNTIHDVGWEGVAIVQDQTFFKSLNSSNNAITNNTITRVGTKWRAKSGIEVFTIGTRIANNEIHDVPRMGILYRGNDNIVEFNKVYRTNLETQDSGAIYSFGRSWLYRGNIVKNNFVYDAGGYGQVNGAWQYPYYTFGIYFDDFSSGNVASNNVVVRSGQAGLIIHGGRDNTITNNFLIDSQKSDTLAMIGINNQSSHLPTMWSELSQMETNGYDRAKYFAKYPALSAVKQTMTNEELYANNKITKNIFYNVGASQHYAVNSRQFLQGAANVSNSNVYWSDKTYNILDSYKNLTYSFAQWQGFGFDQLSKFADPKFVSIANEKFSFMTGSPALLLGIAPINVLLTGPQTQTTTTTPIINIVQPSLNESLSGSAVFEAVVYDATPLMSVTFKIDGKDVATFSSAQRFGISIDTTKYVNGIHTFGVVAINHNGGLGSVQVGFSVSNTADGQKPVISLTSPKADDRLRRTVKIEATATDNVGVIKVEFYVNGVLLKTLTAQPYSYTWNTKYLASGQHTIFARAYDAAGNVGTSSTIATTSGGFSGFGKGSSQ